MTVNKDSYVLLTYELLHPKHCSTHGNFSYDPGENLSKTTLTSLISCQGNLITDRIMSDVVTTGPGRLATAIYAKN